MTPAYAMGEYVMNLQLVDSRSKKKLSIAFQPFQFIVIQYQNSVKIWRMKKNWNLHNCASIVNTYQIGRSGKFMRTWNNYEPDGRN